jgi:hypothetical protein
MTENFEKLLTEFKETKSLYYKMDRTIDDIKSDIEDLVDDKEVKKQERQSALAFDKDVSKLTKSMHEIDLKIEENEDAIIGFENRKKELKNSLKEYERKLFFAHNEIIVEKLHDISKKYNEKAGELAEIVKKFWILHDTLSNRRGGSPPAWFDSFHRGALHHIHTICLYGEQKPHSNYLFDLYFFRNDEKRNLKPEVFKELKIPEHEVSIDYNPNSRD